ncbi:MAG: hypothetical protein HYR88_18275 [Verrucomicrobia bacterium]|nr:hypothetical protein [Verrucomicrobiota bacterium]MBI3871090.1 hypothetical protein [Verrucomicrobiota bacterium]
MNHRFSAWAVLLLASAMLAGAVPVTFQVNLAVQTAQGKFDPSADSVEVHGSFDGWNAGAKLSASATDEGVYVGTVDIGGGVGTTAQFKYVINRNGGAVWENNGVGPAGAQNRMLTLTDAAQTLPTVNFNNESAPAGVTAVTFQLDVEIQIALGSFDPATDTVEARGAFNNWGGGFVLAPDPTDMNIYQGSADITGVPGSAVEYKFVIRHGGLNWEGNVGPGGPNGNRVLTLSDSDQTLPVVYFNNLKTKPGDGVPVTFQVDMSVPIARGRFDPALGALVVAGGFNNWSTTANPLTASQEDPNIYFAVIHITTIPPGGWVPYKFVMNGGGWEGSDNRGFTLAVADQTLPPDFFDRVGNFGPIALTADSSQLSISWAGGPHIRLQQATSLSTPDWTDVPDTEGQSATSLPLNPDSSAKAFFRLVGP